MLEESPHDRNAASSWDQRVEKLLHANHDMREEALRLRYQSLELRKAILEGQTSDWEGQRFRRAALSLLEDAACARRATQQETVERRRAEEALLRAARANAFRITLSDALRPLSDELAIQTTATRLLREHLGASRTAYGEVTPAGDAQTVTCDQAGGLPPLPKQISFDAFDPAAVTGLRAGRPAVADDARNEASYARHAEAWNAAGIAAYVAVPLRRRGQLAATLSVVHATPRAWLAEEIAMVEEAAERTWDALERTRAQAALREAEELHRIALEAAGMGAWDLDVASGRLIWNAQHYRLLGLEPNGHQPWTFDDFLHRIHPQDKKMVHCWQEQVSDHEAGPIEYRILRPDGAVRWLSGFGHAVVKLDGTARRLSGVTFDITERREAETVLAATQERLRLIVDSAHEHAIISLDLERRVTSWNFGAECILGYPAAEIMGQLIDLIFVTEDRLARVPEIDARKALAEGRAVSRSWHVRRDGTLFWANCALLPMRATTGGEVVGFVKVVTDETEMLEARQELEHGRETLLTALREAEHARAEAEAAGLAKDHFLAVLSHELRTPLTPIIMALSALSRRKDLPAPVRVAHAMIERNVQLEAHFIDDMLDVTRIARGRMEIVCADMDLHEAAERAVEVSTPDLEAKRQRLVVALEATTHRVHGDFARLQQALWNLLKNASKFTPEGGEITICSRDAPGQVIIAVADRGIGMEQEVVERIFNPFEQADPTISREFGGLGLGLAIAKATVEAHGGELRASSPGRGQGATFTLTLPLAANV